MGKYSGYLICSDLDGTLTSSNGKISKENSEAIKYFQQNGGLFTINTGRFHGHVEQVCEDFCPNTHIIVGSGTIIYDLKSNRVVYEKSFNAEFYEAALFVRRQFGTACVIHAWAENTRVTTLEDDFFTRISAAGTKWYKMIFCADSSLVPDIMEALTGSFGKRYVFSLGWPGGIDMHSPGTGKAEFITVLKKLIPEKIETLICVGDYENDIPMLRQADIGYAVENAPDFVKAAADRVTVSNDNHAIRQIILDI